MTAVAGLALLATGRLRSRAWYRLRITVPVSLLLAAVALIWTVACMFAL
jgi:hypothetical protein